MIHTWTHFHLNDLTIQYIERQTDLRNTFGTVVRSHSYYTAILNAAGMAGGVLNPHFKKNLGDVSMCEFLLSPWKASPTPLQVFREHVASDVTNHYFIDAPDDKSGRALRVDGGGTVTIDVEEPVAKQKTANPDAFPPTFVQNRLEMFVGEEFTKKHRGFAIYKDYLADNYRVIFEDFVVPLNQGKFIKNEDLKDWVDWMESNGFPGIVECKRDDGYLHIFATFLWLNVIHSSDHALSGNINGNFGIGASFVPLKSLKWYKEHNEYDFVDVLEGKDFASRWKLQLYAMRIRLFWDTHGVPTSDLCFGAHNFVDSNLYQRFIEVDNISNSERRKLNDIHDHFVESLRKVGMPYHWLMNVEDITAGIHY